MNIKLFKLKLNMPRMIGGSEPDLNIGNVQFQIEVIKGNNYLANETGFIISSAQPQNCSHSRESFIVMNIWRCVVGG